MNYENTQPDFNIIKGVAAVSFWSTHPPPLFQSFVASLAWGRIHCVSAVLSKQLTAVLVCYYKFISIDALTRATLKREHRGTVAS